MFTAMRLGPLKQAIDVQTPIPRGPGRGLESFGLEESGASVG